MPVSMRRPVHGSRSWTTTTSGRLRSSDSSWTRRKSEARCSSTAGQLLSPKTARGSIHLHPSIRRTFVAHFSPATFSGAGPSNVVVRSDAVRELGGFDERLFQLCDWDLWIRLALAGESAACAEIVVACIVHPGSMLLVSKSDVLDELDYLEEKHRAASEAHGVKIDRRTFTRWVALGRRRAGRRLESAATYMRGAVRNRDPGNVARAFAALLDVPAREWWARLRGHPHGDGRIVDAAAEPAWLSLYRGDDARKIAAATSKASSPTDR